MHENVHTFQQPLFTWTIGPHAHLAGIPHSPVWRLVCYVLTTFWRYLWFLNSRTATWDHFLNWFVESNRLIKGQPVTDDLAWNLQTSNATYFQSSLLSTWKVTLGVERGDVCVRRLQRLKNTAKYTRLNILSTIFFLLSIFQDEKVFIDDKNFEYWTEN